MIKVIKRVKYNLTPFALLATIIMATSLYHLFFPGPYKMGMLGFFYLFPVALILFVVDFLGQYFATSYTKVAAAEVVLIVLMACGYTMTQRTSTFSLPDEFAGDQVVVVFGVENTPKLSTRGWLGTYEVKVPETGIVLTSSNVGSIRRGVEMKSEQTKGSRPDFEEINGVFADTFKIDVGGTTYECSIWMISKTNTISYGSDDIQNIQEEVHDYLLSFLEHAW